ncbi:MAG: hypothetical protein SFY80_16800 [Verrucomicrobiota bacterium]|nr:hypothetical protein [Verrucomicrobiota bacterium]
MQLLPAVSCMVYLGVIGHLDRSAGGPPASITHGGQAGRARADRPFLSYKLAVRFW